MDGVFKIRLRHKVYYHLARLYLMLKQHDAAAEYRTALAACPGFALTDASPGFPHIHRNHIAEAAAAFRLMLYISPGAAEAWFDLGLMRRQLIRETGQTPEGRARR